MLAQKAPKKYTLVSLSEVCSGAAGAREKTMATLNNPLKKARGTRKGLALEAVLKRAMAHLAKPLPKSGRPMTRSAHKGAPRMVAQQNPEDDKLGAVFYVSGFEDHVARDIQSTMVMRAEETYWRETWTYVMRLRLVRTFEEGYDWIDLPPDWRSDDPPAEPDEEHRPPTKDEIDYQKRNPRYEGEFFLALINEHDFNDAVIVNNSQLKDPQFMYAALGNGSWFHKYFRSAELCQEWIERMRQDPEPR